MPLPTVILCLAMLAAWARIASHSGVTHDGRRLERGNEGASAGKIGFVLQF
jgi:hypothetical protein